MGKGHSASLKPNKGGPFYEKAPDTEKKEKEKESTEQGRKETEFLSNKNKELKLIILLRL